MRLPADLLFANGLGGFTPDGREYCLLVSWPRPCRHRRQRPADSPRPSSIRGWRPPPGSTSSPTRRSASWSPRAGSGFTWSGNSQTNRLTPWSNDPVSDPPGEVVYLRDEETGEIWSPTPLPVPSAEPTLVRHGQGYTVFERNAHGLCPRADPVRPARRPDQADPAAGPER